MKLSTWTTFALAVLTARSYSASGEEASDPHVEEARAIFDWVSGSTDGWVTPKQEVRRAVPGDPSSPLSVFALKRIEAGEVIVRIPWDTLIKSDDPDEEGQLCCGTVRSVAREMRLGNASKFAPYAVYLNNEPEGQIPTAWSEKGKKLLYEVLGEGSIPPEYATDWLEDDWYTRCEGDPEDEISSKAALLVVQRSDDSLMIPAYDAYNHRNGNWTNTKTNIEWGKYHISRATKDIEAGDEIYISYNMCEQCEGRRIGYGTAEILRDYGFVEYLPQRWHYMEEGFQFDLDEDKDGKLTLTWDKKNRPKLTNGKLMEQCRGWFRWEIRRLRRLKNIEWNIAFDDKSIGIPKYEWDTIWKFVDANIVAMTMALESLGPSPPPEISVMTTKGDEYDMEKVDFFHGCVDGEGCDLAPASANGSHYDPLDYEFDLLDYQRPTCNNRKIMKFRDWDDLEFTKTTYQKMSFNEKKSTDDLCMDLDNIVQICASYRPQYHEYVTHAAARFVKDIKRVIFIGGGDSMLLHEALRYPALEKVVGLELDQTVTRKCFKHFKSSPHFDDQRVEWWFGDATKSLLLLPEEYWGSFDLVLVDLSETVMSFSVTKELDVFDALSLLLNPVGVMVKNEMYMEKISSVFDYSMELYYDSPIICSQVLAFGSNNVDFFHDPTYDHGIDTLLYGNMHDPDTRYDLMHGYRKNVAPASICDLKIPEEATEQRTAAGICEIVNAENTALELDKNVGSILADAAKKAGFTAISDPIFDRRMVVLVMKEGYIAARLWSVEKYIGFDINLWGNTYKIASVRADLLEAVGSSDVSLYRVVVGGMYGSNTWKEDQKILGPKMKQLRNCENDVVTEGILDTKLAIDVSIEESIALTLADEITAVVVCGEGAKVCSGVKVLSDHSAIKNVITLHECPGLKEAGLEEKYACEVLLLGQWKEALNKLNQETNLLVMDPTASYEMHQIVSSILSNDNIRNKWLKEHSVVVTWSVDKDAETWRREFLDRFRKAIEFDPMVRAEIVIQAGGKASELGIASTGNKEANYAFEKLERQLRKRLPGTKIELRKIHGGNFNFKKNFKPTVFTLSDYDDGTGKEQFAGQEPLGRQNIFQLVKGEEVEEDLDLNLSKIWDYFSAATKAIKMTTTVTRQYPDYIGDGGVIVAMSDMGNVVLVWDGREHIDVNFFTFAETPGIPEKFVGAFLHVSDNQLKVGLRDEQPRGIGKVVNFASDLLAVDQSKKSERNKKKFEKKATKPDPKTEL